MKLTAPAVGAGSADDAAFYLMTLRETLVYKSRLLGDSVIDDVIDRRVARQAFAEHYSGYDVLAFLLSQGHVKASENALVHIWYCGNIWFYVQLFCLASRIVSRQNRTQSDFGLLKFKI